MIVAGGRGSFDLASSDEDVIRPDGSVHRRMVAYAPPPALATDITLLDTLPDSIVADPAGLSGNGSWSAPAITWTLDELGHDGATFTAVLEPQVGGTLPTAVETVADLLDGWGQAVRVSFPILEIEVIPPTGVPSATPEDTPTPPPTATASPPQPIFLPVAYNERCKTRAVPVEVALVVDISSSMGQPTIDGGPTKLEAAREAAVAFVDALREEDRAAVIAFDAQVNTLATLADGKQSARDALAGLETGAGTRIDLGIAAGVAALGAARDGAWPTLVLLTDGRPTGEADPVRLAAAEARAAGVTLYTIGLGADVDAALLEDVAGDAERALVAPTRPTWRRSSPTCGHGWWRNARSHLIDAGGPLHLWLPSASAHRTPPVADMATGGVLFGARQEEQHSPYIRVGTATHRSIQSEGDGRGPRTAPKPTTVYPRERSIMGKPVLTVVAVLLVAGLAFFGYRRWQSADTAAAATAESCTSCGPGRSR